MAGLRAGHFFALAGYATVMHPFGATRL